MGVLIRIGLIITLIVTSCSIQKNGRGEVIKGTYNIINTAKIASDSALIICMVSDRKNKTPISDAAVVINELKLGGFTSDDGRFLITIPAGKYTISVINVGNIGLNTKPLTFNPGYCTWIKFELGTTRLQGID